MSLLCWFIICTSILNVISVFQFFVIRIHVCVYFPFSSAFPLFRLLVVLRFSFQSFSIHIGIVSLLYESCNRSSWSHWCFAAISISKIYYLDRIGKKRWILDVAMNAYLHCAHEWLFWSSFRSLSLSYSPTQRLFESQNSIGFLYYLKQLLCFHFPCVAAFFFESFARLFYAPIPIFN